jgi:DNA mismatch repair ATPase MutS
MSHAIQHHLTVNPFLLLEMRDTKNDEIELTDDLIKLNGKIAILSQIALTSRREQTKIEQYYYAERKLSHSNRPNLQISHQLTKELKSNMLNNLSKIEQKVENIEEYKNKLLENFPNCVKNAKEEQLPYERETMANIQNPIIASLGSIQNATIRLGSHLAELKNKNDELVRKISKLE